MENFDTKSVRSCILDVISRGGAVHFVGILGAGMLPLARLLSKLISSTLSSAKNNRAVLLFYILK